MAIVDQLAKALEEPQRWLVMATSDDRHFVQFRSEHRRDESGTFDHADVELVLDLPCKALTFDEGDRATEWFQSHGVMGAKRERAVDRNDEPHWLFTWEMRLGADPVRAMKLGIDLMEKVYAIKVNGPLLVTEGSFND